MKLLIRWLFFAGTCLLALAVASSDLEIVKFIFKTLCEKELINEVVKSNCPIIYSIISKNNEILKQLLKYKFDLYQTSAIGGEFHFNYYQIYIKILAIL